jgi:hypothetical protein
LEQHGAADDLRVAHRERSGERRGRRGAQGRHRQEPHRDASLGEHQGGLDARVVLDERRDRADEVGERWPGPDRLAAAGDDGGHLDGVARLARPHHGLALDVLDGVGEGGVQLVEGRSAAVVLGADHRPVEADRGQPVADPGHLADVGLARRAALAGVEVGRLDAAAVRREVRRAVTEVQVVRGIARRQGEGARRGPEGSQHELRRHAHDLGLAVHRRAVRL